MAKLSSILFNRAINQFLECDDLESKKGKQITEKISLSAKDFLEKIFVAITQAPEPQKAILIAICRKHVEGFSEAFFLDSLSHDETIFRRAASDILAKSKPLNSDKLLSRLKPGKASNTEIMALLRLQLKTLNPEKLVNTAVKLDDSYGVQLLKLAAESELPVDLDNLRFHPDKISDPTVRASLVRYLGNITQLAVVEMITRFLTDSNKMVVLEALSSLSHLNFRFDTAVILPFLADMNNVEQKLALEIIDKQADAALIPRLPPYLASKSQLINYMLYKIIASHATEEGLEGFLSQLEKQESWTREQVVNELQVLENENLSLVARGLCAHDDEFIRNSAQKFSGYQLDAGDLEKIGEFALNENWQVRQRAIQTLGKSANQQAIPVLQEVLVQWPDTANSVLEAVRLLGFSNGLEIAFQCLANAEVSVQRAALETIVAITTEQDAEDALENIVTCLPRLNQELKELANKILTEFATRFGLATAVFDTNLAPNPALGDTVGKRSGLPQLKPGSSWMDRYQVRKEIGQGSMGQVVLVEDEMIEELLILKFMHPELTIDKASRERFKREVKYARRVGHPNVIRVHDLLLKDDVCAISMEYFKSRGLEKFLGEGEYFDTREGLQILYQVSDGMAAAHDQSVIHRDLKPSNILINDKGLVKVADFGIASASSSADSTLTKTGSIIGSPAYLAPERAMAKEVDNRSDIYSLGVIAYYMFAGKLPYVGRPMDVLHKHREGNAAMVDEVNPAANSEVARLVKRMMAVEPDQRPQSMIEVRDDIKKILDSV